MRQHLDSPCEDCAEVVARLRSVTELAGLDPEQAPPDYAVRSAKALFSLRRPGGKKLLPRLRLRRVFDSAIEPVPLGIRGSAEAQRRMVYVGGQHSVDLSLEEVKESDAVCWAVIQAQLLGEDGDGVGRIPAFLVKDSRLVSSGVTDERGNVRVRGRWSDSYELLFIRRSEEPLSVSW